MASAFALRFLPLVVFNQRNFRFFNQQKKSSDNKQENDLWTNFSQKRADNLNRKYVFQNVNYSIHVIS